MVRILLKHGRTRAEVAKEMDCSTSTVANVENRITAAGDTGNDWDFVDEEFKKEYPPPIKSVCN
jgi:hypothetical protein